MTLKNVKLNQRPIITPKPADAASFRFYQTFFTECTVRHLIYSQIFEKSGIRPSAEDIDKLVAEGLEAITLNSFDDKQQVLTLRYSVAEAQFETSLPVEFLGNYDASLRITEASKYVFASNRSIIVKADAFTKPTVDPQDALCLRTDKHSKSVYAALYGPSAERADEAQEFAFFVDDQLVQ